MSLITFFVIVALKEYILIAQTLQNLAFKKRRQGWRPHRFLGTSEADTDVISVSRLDGHSGPLSNI